MGGAGQVDAGKAVQMMIYVFNCSEQMDFKVS